MVLGHSVLNVMVRAPASNIKLLRTSYRKSPVGSFLNRAPQRFGSPYSKARTPLGCRRVVTVGMCEFEKLSIMVSNGVLSDLTFK